MAIYTDSWVKAQRNSEILYLQSHHIPMRSQKGIDDFSVDWVRVPFTAFWTLGVNVKPDLVLFRA